MKYVSSVRGIMLLYPGVFLVSFFAADELLPLFSESEMKQLDRCV